MSSWKARLLMAFTMLALVLALSVPAMAVDFDGSDDGLFGDGGPVDFGDDGLFGDSDSSDDNGDVDCEDIDGNLVCDGDQADADTFNLDEGECVYFGGDTVLCNVDGTIQEFDVD